MKKLQMAALAVTAATLAVRLSPLPDWGVRLNGVTMLLSTAALAFSSARLALTKKDQ